MAVYWDSFSNRSLKRGAWRALGRARSLLRDRDFDLVLLQEADWETHRGNVRCIAEEPGKYLGPGWIFAPEFLELGKRIHGADARHGQATLTRLPVSEGNRLHSQAQSRMWNPKTRPPRLGFSSLGKVGGSLW